MYVFEVEFVPLSRHIRIFSSLLVRWVWAISHMTVIQYRTMPIWRLMWHVCVQRYVHLLVAFVHKWCIIVIFEKGWFYSFEYIMPYICFFWLVMWQHFERNCLGQLRFRQHQNSMIYWNPKYSLYTRNMYLSGCGVCNGVSTIKSDLCINVHDTPISHAWYKKCCTIANCHYSEVEESRLFWNTSIFECNDNMHI